MSIRYEPDPKVPGREVVYAGGVIVGEIVPDGMTNSGWVTMFDATTRRPANPIWVRTRDQAHDLFERNA